MNNSKENNKADNKKFTPEERKKFLYHNTTKLLQKYRDVVWSIEASVMQARINFEMEFDCAIEEFLNMTYAAGADFSGTNIESHTRTIERSRKMLSIIDNAINVIRRKNKNGERYYWILYYTYLSDGQPDGLEDIVASLQKHFPDMSVKTFYRRKKEAIDCLSGVLWGYTSKDCIEFLEMFSPEKGA